MNNQRQFDILDILNVFSFLIAIENLQENRDQSAHNDVQSANDQQAKYILDEISRRFEEQNAILECIKSDVSSLKNAYNMLINEEIADC